MINKNSDILCLNERIELNKEDFSMMHCLKRALSGDDKLYASDGTYFYCKDNSRLSFNIWLKI